MRFCRERANAERRDRWSNAIKLTYFRKNQVDYSPGLAAELTASDAALRDSTASRWAM